MAEIYRALEDRFQELCLHLLGEPTRRTSKELRYGRKGSLSVDLRKRVWKDHESDEGGGALQLIQRELNLSKADAIAWSQNFLGDSGNLPALPRRERPTKKAEEKKERPRDELARYLWSIAKPIPGTPAETYLRNRGLDVSALPASLRYLPPHKDFPGSLIGAVTDEAGTIHALQRICITPEGAPALDEYGGKLRPQLGPVSKGVVRFPGDGDLVVVEGIPTGLALNQRGHKVHCVLSVSNFEKHLRNLPKDLPFIIGRDFAHEGEQADLVVRKVFFALAQEGYCVRMANPLDGLSASNVAIPKGLDFLDLFILEGAAAVEKAIAAAEEAGPHFKSDPMDADNISLEIYEAVRDVVSSSEQARIGLAAPAGVGKTEEVLQAIAKNGGGRFVEYFSPNHSLASEIGERLHKQNPSLPIFPQRGRNKDNCLKHDLAKDIANAGLPVQGSLCRKETVDPETGETESAAYCPHYWECKYQLQFIGANQKATPGTRLRATESLFYPRHPEAPKPDLIIIDESLPSPIRRSTLSIAIVADPKNTPGRDELEEEERTALDKVCAVLLTAILDDLPLRKHFFESGITAEVLELAQSAIGKEEVPGIFPDQTSETQRKILNAFKRKGYGRLARAFRLMREEIETISEREHFERVSISYDRRGEKCLEMRYQRKLYIPENASVVWINADLMPEIAEKIIPGISVRTFQAERKDIHITQVCDRTFSLTSLRKAGEPTKRLGEVQGFIDRTATPGTLIVATQKILKLLKIPDGCQGVHWGRHRGRDDLRDCHTVIVVGREEYRADEYEKTAKALFWDDPNPVPALKKGKLAESLRAYRMRDGTIQTARVSVYPHQKAQKYVELGRERETLQAIDRLRLIRNNIPKRAFILCNIPLDCEVDRLVRWKELAPNRLEVALARGGVLPLSRSELARVFPDLWRSADAVKGDLRRGELNRVETLLDLYRETTPFNFVAYRRPKQRGKPTKAVLAGDSPNLRAALEAVVGPVAHFEVIEGQPQAPEAQNFAPEPEIFEEIGRPEAPIPDLEPPETPEKIERSGPVAPVLTHEDELAGRKKARELAVLERWEEAAASKGEYELEVDPDEAAKLAARKAELREQLAAILEAKAGVLVR